MLVFPLLAVFRDVHSADRNPWAATSDTPQFVQPQRFIEERFVPPSYDPARSRPPEFQRSWDHSWSGFRDPVYIDPGRQFPPGSGFPAPDARSERQLGTGVRGRDLRSGSISGLSSTSPYSAFHPYSVLPGSLGLPSQRVPGSLNYPGSSVLIPGGSPWFGITDNILLYGLHY